MDAPSPCLFTYPLANLPLAAVGLTVRVGKRPVCTDWHWRAQPGEWWVVLGPNGAGKSTLLATLAGLRAPQAGTVTFAGKPLAAWSQRALAQVRAFLPQQPILPDPASVMEAVLIGRHPHLSRWQWEGVEDRAIAQAALAAVGLTDLADRPVASLSGGERQRVAIATIFAQQPSLLFLDEPTNHLDLSHQVALLEMLAAFREAGVTLVTALHDLFWANRYATGAILLYGDGRIAAGSARDWLTPEALSELYGVHFATCGEGAVRHLVPLLASAI